MKNRVKDEIVKINNNDVLVTMEENHILTEKDRRIIEEAIKKEIEKIDREKYYNGK